MISQVGSCSYRSLGSILLSLTLVSCSTAPSSKTAQLTTSPSATAPTPSTLPSIPTPSSQAIVNPADANFTLPLGSLAPVLPDVVTVKEVALREQQVQVAKDLERDVGLMVNAGIGTQVDVLQVNYFRLNSEIQLLQAKQLLQLKQKQDLQKN